MTETALVLTYPVRLMRLPAELGGGFLAYHPDFGPSACSAGGETIMETLELLEEVREELIEHYVEQGLPIPEPNLYPLEPTFMSASEHPGAPEIRYRYECNTSAEVPRPTLIEGVPRCSHDDCPVYDGKRCQLLGCRPGPLCEPGVRELLSKEGERVTKDLG